MNKYNRLQKFPLDTHQILVKSKDATFQLNNNVFTMENKVSPVERQSIVSQHIPRLKQMGFL